MGRSSLMESYLAQLPHGADSYPECQSKASAIRVALEMERPTRPLPPVLESLIQTPPPVSAWIPEVQHNALMLAIEDEYHPDRSFQAFLDYVVGVNKKLFNTPLYRILFMVASPERVLSGMTHRWGQFRRGTTVELTERTESGAVITLATPPNLHSKHSAHGLSSGFRAALECGGAKNVRVDVDLLTSSRIVYRARWT